MPFLCYQHSEKLEGVILSCMYKLHLRYTIYLVIELKGIKSLPAILVLAHVSDSYFPPSVFLFSVPGQAGKSLEQHGLA